MTEYKVMLIGGVNVGKTAVVLQFVQQYFAENYDGYNDNSYRKQLILDEEYTLLDILDLSGDMDFIWVHDSCYRTNKGFIMVYSITSRKSFDKLSSLYEHLLIVKDRDILPMVLIGNKCDLEIERQVSTDEGEELAKVFNCSFFETSAKDNINIEHVFHNLIRSVRMEPQAILNK